MKAIIVDDEQLAIDFLERKLAQIGGVEIVGRYVNPLVALSVISQQEVEIVFLDIHLPEISGLELAEQIITEKPFVKIVFVTAYDEFAVNAFELNALDYLIKPIQTERLMKTITRIKQQLSLNTDHHIQTAPKLRIKIGSQVTIEDEVIHWRTTKAQELFLYLFQHRGQLLHKSVIVDLMWHEYEPEKAFSQLYTTIYHIRKKLKKYQNHFKIENSMDGYTLKIKDIAFSLEEWEKGLQSAPPLTSSTIEHYCALMNLNSEIYLQHYDYWWAEQERQRFEQLWLKTAFQIAEGYLENELEDQAVAWYENIQNRHPVVEETYFALMKIFASRELHSLVNRQYQELTKVLSAELDIMPSAHITKWYQSRSRQAVVTG